MRFWNCAIFTDKLRILIIVSAYLFFFPMESKALALTPSHHYGDNPDNCRDRWGDLDPKAEAVTT
jgi:hypothetical protein